MKVLQIINHQHQPLAQITWEHPDVINLAILLDDVESETKLKFESYLTAFIDKFKQDGIPLRTGEKENKHNSKVIYTEELQLIKPNDERFLGALSDKINSLSFTSSNERFFALILEDKRNK